MSPRRCASNSAEHLALTDAPPAQLQRQETDEHRGRESRRAEIAERHSETLQSELVEWKGRFSALEKELARYRELALKKEEAVSTTELKHKRAAESLEVIRAERDSYAAKCGELEELLKVSDQCFDSLERERDDILAKSEERIRALTEQLQRTRGELNESLNLLAERERLEMSGGGATVVERTEVVRSVVRESSRP